MPWSVPSLLESRSMFCELVLVGGMSVSAACRRFRISRKTGYKWLDRYRKKGDAGLVDRGRSPGSVPHRAPIEFEHLVCRYKRQYPYWGPRKLHRVIYEDRPELVRVGISTIARILKRYGLVTPREPAIVYPTVTRFERGKSNELWQMDLKAIRMPDGSKRYIAGILDDHSRFVLGLWWLPDLTDKSVLACWIEAARRWGLPDQTLTDHGSQFRMVDGTTSAFRTHLWACGVQHVQGRVAHPQTQGKIERFWQTLNKELTPQLMQVSPESWERLTAQWLHQYNTRRPHESLGDNPPASRYRPSDRAYVEPDRDARIGSPDSVYRRVTPKGDIHMLGHRLMIGRGLAYWTVEARPLGDGCWHIYFRNHLLKEFVLTKPRTKSVTHVPAQVLPMS